MLSGRVLAWTGGLALLLGAVFFLSLAFSRGWIGPSARVAIGIISGALLVVSGAWFFERRERLFGHVLVAVGLAVLDMAFLAGTRLYDLFPIELALAGTLVSAAAAAVVAVRADSQIVAGYGLAASLLAPPLLGAEPNGPTIAFIAMILAGTTGIALYRYWSWLPPLAFLLSAPQLGDWVTSHPAVAPALIAVAGFWLLHALAAGGEEFRIRTHTLRPTSATLLLANAAYAVWAGFALLDGDLEVWRGLFLAGVALAHLGLSSYFLLEEGDRHPFGMLAFGTGLAALSIAVPVQFGGPIVPIAWAAEAAALVWVYALLGNRYSAGAALVLAAAALTHLVAFEYPLYQLGDDLSNSYPFLTAEGVTLAFLLGAAGVACWFVRDHLVRALLAALGLLLVVYAMPFETSGVALVGGWSAIYVFGVALHLVPPLHVAPVRLSRWENPLPLLVGWETVIPAALAALLAAVHVLAIEAPLDQAWPMTQPETPFVGARTLAIVFVASAALLGGYVMRSLPFLRRSGVIATAFAAYLMPFELESGWAVVTWAILALGMFVLAWADQDGFPLFFTSAAALILAGGMLAVARIATVEVLAGDEPLPAHTPFWSEATLAFGALIVSLLAGFWLHRATRYAPALVITAVAFATYLVPFELDGAAVVVAWSVLALLIGAMAPWQKLNEIAYLLTSATLLTLGAIKTLTDLAPIDQLTGDALQPAHFPFWSAATLAISSIVTVLLAGYWVYRDRQFAPAMVIAASAFAAYLMPFELDDAAVVVAWSMLALLVGTLARQQPADADIFLGTAATLLGTGLLVTLVSIAPPDRLAVDDVTRVEHPLLLSGATLALAALIVPLAAGYWFLRGRRYARWFGVGVGVLAVYLLSVGLVDEVQGQVGGAIALEELEKRAQTGLSILWAVLGGTLLIVGIVRRVMPERLFALALLALATAKVFIIDLASLDAAYRVLSFVGLGILLLASSWAYQHWMPRISGDADDSGESRDRRRWGGPKADTAH